VKILAIGGTGFIGPFVVAQLQQAGHSVTVLHRGKAATPAGSLEILGDRNRLDERRETLAREKFDVVIDFILSSERQAKHLIETFRGIAGRVVALSSMDVYRAWGVFYGLEPGDLEPMPVDETSAVRTQRQTYPPEVLKRVQAMLPWLDDEYDKVRVERAILGDEELPGTVLRLPMVYGPGDFAHRFYPYMKRMDDARRHILFADDVAAMRTPRGYVENVATGIALAAMSDRATGQIYNVGEAESFSELAWARKIASAAGWQGEFVVLPHDKAPPHLYWPGNTAQHLVVSSEKIRQELDYIEPVERDEAIQRTIAWERTHPPETAGAGFDYPAEDAALNEMKAMNT
jgi:nucleoside-diphosphate-sugar epimerase